MKRNRVWAFLLLGGGLLGLVVLFGLVTSTSSTVSASAQTIQGGGNVPANCGKTVHYTAYDAPKGSHNFGPTQHFATTADATSRFNGKVCSDPLFAAIQTEALHHGKDIDAQATMNLARQYVANRKLWANDVRTFNKNVVNMTLVNYDVRYETLGMVPGAKNSVMPQLIKSSQQVALGQSLDVKLKNGQTLHERTACDLQYSVPQFPHVPIKPPAPPKHTTPPTHKPPTNLPPSPPPHKTCASYGKGYSGTYPNCKPPQSRNCMLNGSWTPGCPPNKVDQPVQHEGPGQQTEHKRTPGAPKNAPAPAPQGPAPKSGSPAPPPTKSGSNSGSGSGSGTPGGSTCDKNGCSGGGSQPGSGPTDNNNGGDNNGTNGSGSTGGGDVSNPFG